MPDDAELFAIKDRAADRFLAILGVTAVGIGGRVRSGCPTGEVVIKVFVADKRPASEVPPSELIPAEFEGVPTDVVEMGPGRLIQAPQAPPHPPGKPPVPVADRDKGRRRPLVGGSQMMNEMTGALLGTLGCFLTHRTDNTKVYALTNFHIAGLAGIGGRTATVGSTKEGQPTGEDSITKCCSDIIGRYAGGAYDNTRDAAVVQLDPGMKWKPVIVEIGPVSEPHTITVPEATTQTYPVRKRGARTGLTGGTVASIGTSFTTQLGTIDSTIIVVPNPDPSQPAGTQLSFADEGDSGSALVNDANEVVGLVFADTPDGRGGAVPIDVVLSRFLAVENLDLQVATTSNTSTVNTVPGAAMVALPPELVPALTDQPALAPADLERAPARRRVLVPAVSPWLPGIAPPAPAMLRRLQDDLDRSSTGRALICLWLRHQRELTGLLDGNRRVAVEWHRNGGSALMQMFVRMLGQPALALPATVNGRPLAQCLDRITAVFARFGGDALRADVTRVRAALPEFAGLTYPQIVSALGMS